MAETKHSHPADKVPAKQAAEEFEEPTETPRSVEAKQADNEFDGHERAKKRKGDLPKK